MSKKLTPWFPANVKPAHVGVYKTDADSIFDSYQYWNGLRWSDHAHSIKRAYSNNWVPSPYQNVKWRGLAEKP